MRDRNLSLLTRCKRPAQLTRSGVCLALGVLSPGCGSPTTELEGTGDSHIEQLSVALSVSPNIVISQVYGAGGNTGALYTNDFVELFNRSSAPVSLTGWSVQYASATGGGNFASPIALIGNLAPGQYYLVQAGGGSIGSPMPSPDASGTTLMAAGAGKVALVNIATSLPCNGGSTPCSPAHEANIIDLVGYGNANYFEGSAAPTLSATLAARRAAAGCTDTNQNGSDFTAGGPTPRNTASPTNPCGGNPAPYVASSVPSNSASNVAVTSDVTIHFSEDVVATGSWFNINCTVTGSVSAAVSEGPVSYVLDPTVSLTAGETCTVTVIASQVTDVLGASMAANHMFSFTTGTPVGVTPIHAIQGASHISPLNGAAVTTRGIVTAVTTNGYYLAEPVADANPSTSEGIFVFTGSAPGVAVGNDVQVTASVTEFRPGCSGCAPSSSAYANLTTTELSSVTAQSVLSIENPLPAPVVIGIGGRTPPTTVIEDDATGDVELVPNTFDPAHDGLDFYESLEGMRVQINNAVVVGPTSSFSSGKELPVLADNGSQGGLRTSRGGIIVSATDFNPERLTLSNYLVSSMPDANVGDTFPGAIVGVMDYSFANFKLLYSQTLPALVATGVTPETLSLGPRRSLELDFAAFNVENLDPFDPPAKFAQLATILVNNLQSPDVVSLGEIQDNDGPTNSGTVSATTTLNMLVSAITAAGGPSYSHRNVNPVNNQDGGEPGGNIRVAFLYRTDRGVAFVDRPGAGSTTANVVVNIGGAPALQFSPGRIDPTNSAFSSSRKPLIGEFTFQSRTFFVLANHFNSKGGDEPLFGRLQPPVLNSEAQRIAQATVVASFVQQILAIDPNAPIVLLGDLNDFEFSPPVTVLKNAQLTALVETLPPAERYSYVYQGNSQVLDHGMVSPGVLPHLVGYDIVHVNSEFVNPASDHDPSLTRVGFDFTPPVISGPNANIQVSAGPGGGVATFSVSALDNLDGSLPVSCTPPSGTTFAVGTTPVTCTATDTNGNSTQFGFAVVVTLSATPVPLGPGWLLTRVLPALLMGLGFALRRRKR